MADLIWEDLFGSVIKSLWDGDPKFLKMNLDPTSAFESGLKLVPLPQLQRYAHR